LKPLQIDFAPRHGWLEAGSDKRHRSLWAVLCVLMLVLLGTSLATAWKLQRERSVVNARVAALQTALEVGQESEARNDSVSAEAAQSVQQANEYLNYPWANMLGTLERNAQPPITLISLEMGVMRQTNKLVIEAADVGAALGYVETLRKQPAYSSLMLMRQEKAGTDGAPVMRFTLEAPVAQPEQSATKAGAQ
jgi:hypothetical protein